MMLFASDGTWKSDEVDNEKDTNVCRFLDAFPKSSRNRYTKGVGTKWGIVGKMLGGALGIGGWSWVLAAERHLKATWDGKEPLVIIGFSRGGALALDFANEVSKGVKIDGQKRVPQVLFLGLWDVVASFGIPGNKINLGYQLTVGAHITNCCHAIALDERRYNFGLTRIKYSEDSTVADGKKRAIEVWFRGGHSDIGGGNENPRRSNIALRWMMLRAIATGVPLNGAQVPPALKDVDPEPPVKLKDSLLKKRRDPQPKERVHYTVKRSLNCGYLDPLEPWIEQSD